MVSLFRFSFARLLIFRLALGEISRVAGERGIRTLYVGYRRHLSRRARLFYKALGYHLLLFAQSSVSGSLPQWGKVALTSRRCESMTDEVLKNELNIRHLIHRYRGPPSPAGEGLSLQEPSAINCYLYMLFCVRIISSHIGVK